MRTTGPTLLGRTDELSTLDQLVADTREGRGGALVLKGEAGIGKTALLEATVAAAGASGPGLDPDAGTGRLTVLRGAGIEPESRLPFAGLHLLLHPVLDHVEHLPPEHASALGRALDLTPEAGHPAGRHAVGLALLELLGMLATTKPVLVVVDDAHWLDLSSAEALLFAARRLDFRPVAMLLAARTGHAPAFPAPGLRELTVPRLDEATITALLTTQAPGTPRHELDRVVAEADGNPLAALELAADRRGTRAPGASTMLPTHSRLVRSFADRITALPYSTRTLLVVAAADGTCDTGTVLAAAHQLGSSLGDLHRAEEAELLAFTDTCLWVRHPIIRTAAYQSAPVHQRIAAHTALADVLDTPDDADRRAWHLAATRTRPDADVARALADSAEHARARGGLPAVADAYERAARLSPDPADRGRRHTEAARAAAEAGQLARACALAREAADQLGDPVERARALMTYAVIADDGGDPGEARRIVAEQAPGVADNAPALAENLLLWAAESARETDAADDADRIAATADRLALPGAARVRALAAAARGSAAERVRALRAVLATTGDTPTLCPDLPSALRGRVMVGRWHLAAGDHATALRQARGIVADCRTHAADGALPSALALLATAQEQAGHHDDAQRSAAEGARLAEEIGLTRVLGELRAVLARLAAVRGSLPGTDPHPLRTTAGPTPPGTDPRNLSDLGHGRHDAVLERLSTPPYTPTPHTIRSVPDLVEAAVHAARPGSGGVESPEWARRTNLALHSGLSYTEWAMATGRCWARAVAARCLAQLDDLRDAGGPAGAVDHAPGGGAPDGSRGGFGEVVAEVLGDVPGRDRAGEAGRAPESERQGVTTTERLFRRALTLHDAEPGHPFERARTELAYGEWLRRRRRRSQARAHLRTALDLFEGLEARPWCERVRAELRAAGDRADTGTPDSGRATGLRPAGAEPLTPQESRIVELAAEGLSNREIGSRLFVSPRTVGYHLYKAYPKLGVSSRGELAALGFGHLAPAPAA